VSASLATRLLDRGRGVTDLGVDREILIGLDGRSQLGAQTRTSHGEQNGEAWPWIASRRMLMHRKRHPGA
jgi:hypothetical protein